MGELLLGLHHESEEGLNRLCPTGSVQWRIRVYAVTHRDYRNPENVLHLVEALPDKIIDGLDLV